MDIFKTEEERLVESKLTNDAIALLYKELTSSETGMIFCGMMMVESGLFKNSFVSCNTKVSEPEPNAMQLSFLEGRRSVAGGIHDILYTIDDNRELQFKCVWAYDKWRKDLARRTKDAIKANVIRNTPPREYDIITDIEEEV